MATVDTDERYKKGFFDSLAKNPVIDEIDNLNMDDGRFFVHLKAQFAWEVHQHHDVQHTKSFGSIKEARDELKSIIRESVYKIFVKDCLTAFQEGFSPENALYRFAENFGRQLTYSKDDPKQATSQHGEIIRAIKE